MIRFSAIPLFLLAACATLDKTPLHEMNRDDVPSWKMVSLTGLDDHLRQIHDTGEITLARDNTAYPIETGNTTFEEFSQANGRLTIFGTTEYETEETIHINFVSCNANMGRFTPVADKLVYQTVGQSAISCERVVKDRDGGNVVVITPMLVDDYFISMVSKISDYTVSQNGKQLALVDSAGAVLGVFSRVSER